MRAASSLAKAPSREPLRDSAEHIIVLIADDSRMACQLLKNALKHSRYRFYVSACAVTRSEITDSLSKHHADVALVSEHLQDGAFAGFEILDRLRTSYPKTRIILLLRHASQDLVVNAFRGGAKGVFCRTDPVEALCKCIRAVYKGQIWATSSQLHSLLEALVQTAPLRVMSSQGRTLLAKREDQVANLVAEGLTNREIAHKLGLSEHTVSNYLFRIYNKLGISSRVELVLYVLRQRQQP